MSLHYIDIQLQADPDFPAHQLLSALYAKLHRALVQLQSKQIGVGFPDYSERPISLGSVLRLFGPEAALAQLMAQSWLTGMHDHVRVTASAPVPTAASHRWLTRKQAKSNPQRLRRRQMKRHGISADEALARVPDTAAEQLYLPFVQIRSASTGQSFNLFLALSEPVAEPSLGEFNAYGLSANATVPWF
ncbi:type I-F CRISPR-associated endoribonuclease Cas6/Csy4 [Paucibacter sp. KBW04]|uniref:type I-F CRISPR-associated endoribonuclease Cas6/Csy4 n=1 Tax=Paucibacter sp. KBW04 TaxID=2153361 RepID=UPI000F57B35C|nr:type I-F CRISPR-associated endoribonuclease Cas6/Csy4 [Paucibacter sp. KBW04]RQO53335.1 type I-F CRISPR-associated endoribonuclease Cas6/Csy4 [Paucibacter sp. KBW04]